VHALGMARERAENAEAPGGGPVEHGSHGGKARSMRTKNEK
jgi:hypothetical protein